MARDYCLSGAKMCCILFTLLLAASAHATLSDCNLPSTNSTCITTAAVAQNAAQSPIAKEMVPAVNAAARTEFQISHSRSASAMPETAPLLVLFGALLIVLLIRAKRFNSK